MSEGYILLGDFRTYYKVFGERSKKSAPIVVLQGGPGESHHYMLGLRKLASENQQVIFYDQFGSGLSDGRDRPELWTMQTFINQLDGLRRKLDLDQVHLIGHSFGGMLTVDYLLTEPAGVRSVTLSSAMISMPLYQQEVDILVSKLPDAARKVIDRGHKKGKVDTEEFREAFQEFNKRHIFRGDTWPVELRTPAGMNNQALYRKLWGLTEAYTATGDFREWDRVQELPKIHVPTLVTAGKYDELTPAQAELTSEKVTGARLKIFEDCSHCHHVENEADYLSTVSDFTRSIV